MLFRLLAEWQTWRKFVNLETSCPEKDASHWDVNENLQKGYRALRDDVWLFNEAAAKGGSLPATQQASNAGSQNHAKRGKKTCSGTVCLNLELPPDDQ